MAKLVDQELPTLFQGVSRQPDSVRLAGQVEEADNILFSVVSGGFENRMPTEHISALASALDDETDVSVYMWQRDTNEKYAVVIYDGDLKVFDLADGTEKTVTFTDGKDYLTNASGYRNGFAFTTILDVTMVTNKSVEVEMDSTVTTTTIHGPAKSFNDLPRKGETIQKYLEGYSTDTVWGSGDTGVTAGDIWKVQTEASDLSKYFVELSIEANDNWVWTEAADPNNPNAFDASTMPHILRRESDGSFTFEQAEWSDREVGDPDIVPDPDFVGAKIADLFYWRDRLGVAANETIYTSQAGDYFNFWPEKATDVADSDPLGRVAGGTQVNIIRYAVPFSKALFVTSDAAQFELSSGGSDILTPNKAVMDDATAYQIDRECRPLVLGDELYFAASTAAAGAIFEYYYDESSAAKTATEASIHARGYIPTPVYYMTGDTTTSTIFCLTGEEPNALFVYRSYWNGDERVQRAWSRWTFEGYAQILGIEFLDGRLYIIARMNDGSVHLEKMYVERIAGPGDHPTAVLLDHRITQTGTYSSGTNLTTWTLPYPHDSEGDTGIVLSTDFGDGQTGRIIAATESGTATVTAVGDFSGGEAILGRKYEASLQLSKQYVREKASSGQLGRAITNGVLRMKRLFLQYEDTGYFEVVVTPEKRSAKTYTMTGRILGSGLDLLGGGIPLVPDGTFKCRVGSKGDTVQIVIRSATPIPFRITAIRWVGLFNELTRQE
jgi:hypothetical protein